MGVRASEISTRLSEEAGSELNLDLLRERHEQRPKTEKKGATGNLSAERDG